ncbi:hypothetical protein [Rhizobium mongolense]|uniref:Uncharacterized protein n=1 Tax=Rhizobium mongolense TaxID=57676 RepID=A0ABR6IPP6_9HYPH|nr:hypothetical protein [Rhizobium mongolense]MBB4229858.1 hypothetical protein [Rhizobium mongolense]
MNDLMTAVFPAVFERLSGKPKPIWPWINVAAWAALAVFGFCVAAAYYAFS